MLSSLTYLLYNFLCGLLNMEEVDIDDGLNLRQQDTATTRQQLSKARTANRHAEK